MALWPAALLFAGAAVAESLTRRPRIPTYQTTAFKQARAGATGARQAADIVVGEVVTGKAR